MTATRSVPKILHQTWKTEDVPEAWRSFAASWRRLHPDWEYRLWTNETNREFVASQYPSLLATYDAYSYDIQRADIVRYCLLHHFGGVYADLDIECLQPVDKLVGRGGFIGVMEPAEQSAWLGTTELLSNAFMASSPGHPFLEAVIERARLNPARGLTHRDVLEITGPLLLQGAHAAYQGDDITILPSPTVFPFIPGDPEMERLRAGDAGSAELRKKLVRNGTYGVHYWANSWVSGLAGELVNPRPHAVEGYDFYPGLDSPGNDVANVGRDVPRAAVTCAAMPEVVAFNTDGFAKARLLSREQWEQTRDSSANTGLYVKKRLSGRGLLSRARGLGASMLRTIQHR